MADGRNSPKIHFSYEDGKEHADPFARELIAAIGQCAFEEAEIIVTVGGDGQLLQALRHAHDGQKVCGIVPPGSKSTGFWTNRGIETPAQLLEMLEFSESYAIKPLKVTIGFADGSIEQRHGYNDISIRSVAQELSDDLRAQHGLAENDLSVQSTLLDLTVSFNEASIGPMRVQGTGLIFCTALGSTAMNRNYDGPSVDIRQDPIILTGMGTSAPFKGFNPVVNAGDTRFDLDVLSPLKRPVMMTFDSFALTHNKNHSAITHLTIESARDKTVRLVLGHDPGIRAYSALTP
jgi:NAD+ kinase